MSRVRLTTDEIHPGAELSVFEPGGAGAVVSFSGLCRADPGVDALELEAYPGFTEPAVGAFVDATVARFGLIDVRVVHRTGLVTPGEAIVFVAAAAVHRRAAFQAVDCLMDWLKSRAPFWKKAHGPASGGWIEPRPEDYADANRWGDEPGAPALSGAAP